MVSNDGNVLNLAMSVKLGTGRNVLNLAMSVNCISFISQTLQSKVHALLYTNMHMATKHTTPTNTLATFIHLFTLYSPAMLLVATI
jgi:hypothetical protein